MRSRKIMEAAIEMGVALPYLRSANRVWSAVFSKAMEQARFEP
jgi:hypothetical protein